MNGCKVARWIVPLAAMTLLQGRTTRADDGAPMPPNVEKIGAALVKRGALPAGATAAERDAAIQRYVQQKLRDARRERNVRAGKALDAREEAANRLSPSQSDLHGRKLGGATPAVSPSSPQWKPLEGTDKLLLIAVEFSDVPYTWTPTGGTARTAAGPLHNQLPVPDNTQDLYVPDFSLQHYEDMLFTPGGWKFPSTAPRYASERRGSMRDYYVAQSYGRYAVDGKAYGWYQLPRPEAYYGDDDPAGGHDNRGPGTMTSLIQHAVSVINADPDPARRIPWSEYDTDGDCIIDHPLFIHAGADQSGGGGAQGDDAIWAHSSSRLVPVEYDPACTASIGAPYRVIYNYTIMPEDGGVGVFAHEFGHDLGLPDEYDTIYSGRGESVAFWSLMSSGSWTGQPAQTEPPSISIWGRYSLGWLNPGDNLAVTDVDAVASSPIGVRLEQSERWGGAGTYNAVRVNLPPKQVVNVVPPEGVRAWYGGKGDEMDNTLRRTLDLSSAAAPITLSFQTWYDIEEDWDYGFVQVSADGGATWQSLVASGMTATPDPQAMPAILANLENGGAGFTGSSGGWVARSIDLSAFAGKNVLLQFRYMTDWGTTGTGWYVDTIAVTAGGATLLADGAEVDDPAWSAAGWKRDPGYTFYAHYYMLEWRNLRPMQTPYGDASIVNFDAGLEHVYQYDPFGSTGNVNQPWYYAYSPGLVLWYRDTSFTDNWTRSHLGHGYLLVVDAHAQALKRPPGTLVGGLYQGWGALPWNTNVQSADAAFGLDHTADLTLGYWGEVRSYAGNAAVPSFNDSLSYWNQVAPDASSVTPRYGLKFRVLGAAPDASATLVGLGAN